MSASSPPLVVNVMNGRPHSQNSSTTTTSAYAGGAGTPSSNDGVGQFEQNGVAATAAATSASVQQNAPLGHEGGYTVAGPSSAPVNGFARCVGTYFLLNESCARPNLQSFPCNLRTDAASSNVYAPSHNEQIIDHLYNAGFQMGVRGLIALISMYYTYSRAYL